MDSQRPQTPKDTPHFSGPSVNNKAESRLKAFWSCGCGRVYVCVSCLRLKDLGQILTTRFMPLMRHFPIDIKSEMSQLRQPGP